VSEPAPAQAVKKIVAAARAAAGRVQHLAMDGMGALLVFQPLSGAACSLDRATEVEDEKADGERCEGETR